MTKRQIAFGVTCLLVGILVGMELAETLDVLVRLVVIVTILLLCVSWRCPTSREGHQRAEALRNVHHRGVRGGSHKEETPAEAEILFHLSEEIR